MWESDDVFNQWDKRMNMAFHGTDADRPRYARFQSAKGERSELLMERARLREEKATALYSSASTDKINKELTRVEGRIDDLELLLGELKINLPAEAIDQLYAAEAVARDADTVEATKVEAANARREKARAELEAAEKAVDAAVTEAGRVHGKTFVLEQAIRYHEAIFGAVEPAVRN